MERLKYELSKIYPNKRVVNLSSEHNEIYSYAFNIMKKNNFKSMSELLDSIGYIYIKNSSNVRKESLVKEIRRIFPDGEIKELSKHSKVYYHLQKYMKDKGITFEEFLKENNFTYIKCIESRVDTFVASELKRYGLTLREIGLMFGVTRERVRQILDKNKNKNRKNKLMKLEFDEEKHVEMMIHNNEFSFNTDTKEIRLLNNEEKECAILVNGINGVKLISEESIPDNLLSLIKKKRLDILSELDVSVLEDHKNVSVMKRKYLLTSYKRKEISKGAKKRKLTLDEYAKFLGYEGAKTVKDTPDEKFINFFEENLIDSKVYISSNSKNQWIRSYAHREGMGLKEFVEFFGYEKAERDFEQEFEQLKERYKILLRKYLKENSNKIIYLSSYAPEYNNIYALCNKKGIDFDVFLAELGYERSNKGKRDLDAEAEIKSDIFYKNKAKELREKIINHLEESKDIISGEKYFTLEYNMRKRNRELVNELKELYNHNCQLCEEDGVPIIEMENGKKYVEVHHIVPLKEEKYNEEENLDKLENMIVLCPHHHKVLHYHLGGYLKYIERDGELIFINDSESEFKITRNFHLEHK